MFQGSSSNTPVSDYPNPCIQNMQSGNSWPYLQIQTQTQPCNSGFWLKPFLFFWIRLEISKQWMNGEVHDQFICSIQPANISSGILASNYPNVGLKENWISDLFLNPGARQVKYRIQTLVCSNPEIGWLIPGTCDRFVACKWDRNIIDHICPRQN